MAFKATPQVQQLLEHFWHFLRHFANRFRGADSSDNILTLSVDEVLAKHFVFPSTRIAGETDACGAAVSQVSKDHGDDINGCAAGHLRRDVELLSVVDGSAPHP